MASDGSARPNTKGPDLMEDYLFVDLHTLSATPVVVCRYLVLQQALQSMGISMHETSIRYDESNEVLTNVKIGVPPHIKIPRLKEDIFYGDWCETAEAALQSACSNALIYLQKVNIVSIDCIHSAELKHCQQQLLEASSWAEAFQDRAAKLQAQLDAMSIVKNKPLPKESPDVSLTLATLAATEEMSSRCRFQNRRACVRRALFPPPKVEMPFVVPREATENQKRCRAIVNVNRATREDTVLHAAVPLVPSGEAKGKAAELPSKEFSDPKSTKGPLLLLHDIRYGTSSLAVAGNVGNSKNNP